MPLQQLPHLLPQNRRLRHLRGIYLRNLHFTRPRGRTIDDAAINTSPTKLQALRDSPTLQHARSSETLRPDKVRRRSTNFAAADPATRQKQMQLAFDAKTADAFFSLHCAGEEVPVYISETREKATNFNFQFFNLEDSGATVARSSIVTIRIWVQRQGKWSLLIEQEMDLRELSYIQTLQGYHFPPNSIAIHLVDGVYAFDLKSKTAPPKQVSALPTSSYNALMRLSNLDKSIQDAYGSSSKVSEQINAALEQQGQDKASELAHAIDGADRAEKALAQQMRLNRGAERKRDELQASILARRAAIATGRAYEEKASKDVENASEQLATSRTQTAATHKDVRGQRRRICEDLINIFKIAPTASNQTLSFQICGIPLPNTEYGSSLILSSGEDGLSAALGHVARLTDALQYYLGVALPYEITVFGSLSTIRDDISIMPDRERDFPLFFPRGGSSKQYRFDYAWFLLNKNIETLCNAQGLKVVDIRHTLPNLKYLLYVCSAGTDEVPERKKGGVRGLWADRMQSRGGLSLARDEDASTAASSRRNSNDSEAELNRDGAELRKAVQTNGKSTTLRSPSSPPPPPMLFGEGETILTFRSKGLRENVGG